MFDQLSTILQKMSEADRIFENVAKIHKKMYDSLVKVGFSPEQAIQLICSQPILPTSSDGSSKK